MHPSGRSSAFRSDIEGLRGIAVLAVVAYHCGVPGIIGGFTGVDVFFVLSGYLITGLLVSEIERTSRLDLLQFYARRARRLLPACALTLLATLMVSAFVMAPSELAYTSEAAAATAVYGSNFFFAITGSDYFASRGESNPLLHTWSLAVEEQFYFAWPLLILAGARLFRKRTGLAAMLAGITVGSLVLSILLTWRGNVWAFYSLPSRAWEFSAGGLAALIPASLLPGPPPLWLSAGWAGLAAILGSTLYIHGDAGFPGALALIPAGGTIVTLLAGARLPGAGVGWFLDNRVLQVLGKLSYSWYLWHWPCLVLCAALFVHLSLPLKLAAALGALLLAAATHRLVENPIRFNPTLVRRPKLSLVMAGGLTVGSLLSGFLALRFADALAGTEGMRPFTVAANDITDISRDQCVSERASTSLLTCVFGKADSDLNIVLFGDSHALMWLPPLRRIAESEGWRLTTFLRLECPAADVAPNLAHLNFRRKCLQWRQDAIRQIVVLRPSLVLLGSAIKYLGRGGPHPGSLDVPLAEWQAGTRRTYQSFAEAGLDVVQIRDTPFAPFDAPTCLARLARHAWAGLADCRFPRDAAMNPAIFAAERKAAHGLANVRFIDLSDELCDGAKCWSARDGLIVYYDNAHLTGAFASALAAPMKRQLLTMLPSLGGRASSGQ